MACVIDKMPWNKDKTQHMRKRVGIGEYCVPPVKRNLICIGKRNGQSIMHLYYKGEQMRVVSLGDGDIPKGEEGIVIKDYESRYFDKWDTVSYDNSGNTCRWIAKKDVKILKEAQISRGDRVLVWDDNEEVKKERIYLTSIEGLVYPHIVVSENHEDKFKQGEEVLIQNCKHMEPLPKKVEMTLEEIEKKLGYEKGTLRVKK